MNGVTIEQIRAQAEKLRLAKAEKEAAALVAKEAEAKVKGEERELLSILELADLDRFDTEDYSFSVGDRRTVLNPRDVESKKALAKYLTERGVFWEYFTINNQSLNSFWKAEEAIAHSEGRSFELPGVEPPKVYTYISMRKKQ